MKIKDLPKNKWFPWIFILLLLLGNIFSYYFTSNYFKKNVMMYEEVSAGNVFVGASKLIDWAENILRFFRGPQ